MANRVVTELEELSGKVVRASKRKPTSVKERILPELVTAARRLMTSEADMFTLARICAKYNMDPAIQEEFNKRVAETEEYIRLLCRDYLAAN